MLSRRLLFDQQTHGLCMACTPPSTRMAISGSHQWVNSPACLLLLTYLWSDVLVNHHSGIRSRAVWPRRLMISGSQNFSVVYVCITFSKQTDS